MNLGRSVVRSPCCSVGFPLKHKYMLKVHLNVLDSSITFTNINTLTRTLTHKHQERKAKKHVV